jgi:hypothetical protein
MVKILSCPMAIHAKQMPKFYSSLMTCNGDVPTQVKSSLEEHNHNIMLIIKLSNIVGARVPKAPFSEKIHTYSMHL